MHHFVFGINLQIHSVSLTILVSIHRLIHFSTHFYHHPYSHHPSLHHSFTPGSKPTFSANPSHRRFLLPTGLPHDNGTGPDLSCSLFLPCDAMHKRGLCRHAVSVYLSVTFVSCVKINKDIFEFFHHRVAKPF